MLISGRSFTLDPLNSDIEAAATVCMYKWALEFCKARLTCLVVSQSCRLLVRGHRELRVTVHPLVLRKDDLVCIKGINDDLTFSREVLLFWWQLHFWLTQGAH